MKSLMSLLFFIGSTAGAQLHQLEASGIKYDTYEIYESNVKSVSVLIDYELVQTNCHGLDYLYEAKALGKNRFIVSKTILLKPMFTCPDAESKTVQAGIRLEIPVEKGIFGAIAHAEVIVPSDSAVVMKLDR
ncbi:MAG: hypothetical protein A2622_14035 [Bdellovibrionales bacterium RIFCSPHIGHO2_01_FULL_40_29]|nr:MAG: hypothetical protein A2622_14035 [Bdellovibrionales bacterium RIFCSPHIGHO2_01_FULL_40_29]OFZ33640.1 MAG: hypothetical protein A3D17_11645 [Bdellovibrionales bacterium RIFCSPHIGHO2_02_FULL_40_15]